MNQKKLGFIIIIVLLIAIPVTIYLVKQTQIFKPRAGNVNESRVDVFQNGNEVISPAAGVPTVTDPNVQLKIYYVPSPSPSAS